MINPTDSQMEYERDGFLSILTDLITELRGYRHRARSDMADEYEQRLREVQNASL